MADDEEDEKPAKKGGGGDSDAGGDSESGEGGGGGGKSFSPLKILLFVGVPVVLLLAIGLTAYFLGWLSFLGGGEEVVEEEHAVPVQNAVFIDLPRMTVNLATTGNQRALLQLTMSVEVANEGMRPAVEAVLPRVVDAFQIFLRDLRVEDLAGTRGTYRLKEEMLTRANAALAPLRVEDVLFREMLVQ
jgi:flagellar protein FliL